MAASSQAGKDGTVRVTIPRSGLLRKIGDIRNGVTWREGVGCFSGIWRRGTAGLKRKTRLRAQVLVLMAIRLAILPIPAVGSGMRKNGRCRAARTAAHGAALLAHALLTVKGLSAMHLSAPSRISVPLPVYRLAGWALALIKRRGNIRLLLSTASPLNMLWQTAANGGGAGGRGRATV